MYPGEGFGLVEVKLIVLVSAGNELLLLEDFS